MLRKTTILFSLLSLSACALLGGKGGGLGGAGGIGGPKVPPVYGPYSGSREVSLQTSINVPPDRASLAVKVVAHNTTFEGAAGRIRAEFGKISSFAKNGCSFNVMSYEVPVNTSETKWVGGGKVELIADLKGKDQPGIMNQMDACFGPFRKAKQAMEGYDSKAPESAKWVGPILPPFIKMSVDNVESFRAELVKQANNRMKAVEAADSKLWDHADVQCSSVGVIEASQHSSHWVTLNLEMLCPVSYAVPEEVVDGEAAGAGKKRR